MSASEFSVANDNVSDLTVTGAVKVVSPSISLYYNSFLDTGCGEIKLGGAYRLYTRRE